MESITFRQAVTADCVQIASLHTESWRNSYRNILPDAYLDSQIAEERLALWEDRLAAPGSDRRHVLLAELHSELAGFCCVLLDEEPEWGACLDNLHVRPDLQGQGLGRQLFARATGWVTSEEPGWPIHLWVFEANYSARRFYERLSGQVVEHKIKEMPQGAGIPSLRYFWRDPATLLNDLTVRSNGRPETAPPSRPPGTTRG